MRLEIVSVFVLTVAGLACEKKPDDAVLLAEADQRMPAAVAHVDALLAIGANEEEAPECEGPIDRPLLLFSQERLDSLPKGTAHVSGPREWKGGPEHPCYVKDSMSSVQTVEHYRKEGLPAYTKASDVAFAVKAVAECHAALKSIVLFRPGEVHAAKLLSDDVFQPGRAEGQLRVHDPDGALRCTLPLSVTSDQQVRVDVGETKEGKQGSLDFDLAYGLEQAAVAALGEGTNLVRR